MASLFFLAAVWYNCKTEGSVIKIITVKDQLKAACDVAGITMTELGRQMGMSQQTFSSRASVGKFSKEEYERMAKILGAEFIFRFKFPDGTLI